MNAFTPTGQAQQDRFVFEMLDGKREGTFCDVGCSHPVELSNTYALEQQLGWRGLLIDRSPHAIKLCEEQRASKAICADALDIDWGFTFGVAMSLQHETQIGFLSLDLDENTLPVLKRMEAEFDARTRAQDSFGLKRSPHFRVVCAEHDLWRFGPEAKLGIEDIMRRAGYDLVCEDVCSAEGDPYENWYCCPSLSARADRFRCKGKRWPEIFKL